MSRKERVVAAMSGGVDSAVAAGLLVEAGYDVVGITMKMYAPTKPAHAKSCCGADDFDDARRSAQTLGIPHYVLDFEETFRRNVIDRFASDYATGRTPNPCVSCNNFVKLGTLRQYAQRIGATFIATGHYARLEQAFADARQIPNVPGMALGDLVLSAKSSSPADEAAVVGIAAAVRAKVAQLLAAQTKLDLQEFLKMLPRPEVPNNQVRNSEYTGLRCSLPECARRGGEYEWDDLDLPNRVSVRFSSDVGTAPTVQEYAILMAANLARTKGFDCEFRSKPARDSDVKPATIPG